MSKLRNLVLKNRTVMPPMCRHPVHYGNRAVGGVAAIIREATAVNSEGRIP